jgi:hypothetical protein
MCLGGPNHCRVGWAGSQSYLLSIDRRKCMQLLIVCLMSSCCVRRGLCLVHRRVVTQSRMCLFPLYTRTHTLKKKKKKKLHLL